MFFENFSGMRTFTEAKAVPHGGVVDNALFRLFFLARWGSDREGATYVIGSHRLNIMVRAIAATVARDLFSGSSQQKLRKSQRE